MKQFVLFITLVGTAIFSYPARSQTPAISSVQDTASYPYWIEMMQDPTINFFSVRSAFNKYWEHRTITRGCGWKPFKRWEYMMESRVSPSGERPPENRTLKAYDQFYADPANLPRSGNGNWACLGPYDLPLGDRGYKGLGRINAIGFHPTDPNTIYIGAPSGGLWFTNDGGQNWSTNTDNLPTLGVSAILVDYTNPQIIYMGTGDRDAGDAPGLGVMKSFDGGITWELHNAGMDEKTVGRLIIHPSDPLMLLAATSGGIYKTTDGGLSWINNYPGNFKDIVFKINDPSVVFATSNGKFYKSTDTGNTWSQITAGLTIGARGVIGVTPANPEVVYFLLADGNNEFQGLYKSVNSALSFVEKSNSPNIMDWSCDGSGSGGQAWYDLEIAVDPLNENIIYSGGVNVWKSTNGGSRWTINSHWYGGCGKPSVHADQHVFEYSLLTGKLYIGNDGGIYWTDNGGTTWNEISSGLAISQTYKLGQSATVDDLVINGYQDNGSSVYEGSAWTAVNGGDGMECAVDPTDMHYRYSTLYFGDIFRHYNNANQGKIAGINTNGITESGGWVTPFIIDEKDPNTMFIGYKNIWRSKNIKAPNVNSVTWTKISNGFTGSDLNVLEQSPANTNILYVTVGNKLYRSDNCQTNNPTWTNITYKLPVNQVITDLEGHPFLEDVVYMTMENRVYKSPDKGNSWIDITGLLPDVHISSIAYNKQSLNGIYIATDMGVFYRDASFCGWSSFSNGLPASARITELEIFNDTLNPANDRIKASTYGRGLWKSDLYFGEPMAGFSADQTEIPVGCAVSFHDLSLGVPFTWQWSFPGGTPSGSTLRNPSGITYSQSGKYDVQLIVTNPEGCDTLTETQYINVSENLLPVAGFSADKTAFCSTEQPVVRFTDHSGYCPNAWNWSFDPPSVAFVNGTGPGSQNPDVQFMAEGSYTVTLIAANINGTDTSQMPGYINIGGRSLPFIEDFEQGFSKQNWEINNPDDDMTWQTTTVVGPPPGDQAAWMNLYSYLTQRNRDRLVSPVLDFTGNSNISLTFSHAYAKRYNSSNDSLVVYLSTDCGNNWTRVFAAGENGSGNFATHPLTAIEFIPESENDWCGGTYGSGCNTVDLSAWAGHKNIRIMFESYNFLGNDLYLDNIAIVADTSIGSTISGTIVYPKTSPVPLSAISLDLNDNTGNTVASAITGDNGRYTFLDINDGLYHLVPSTIKSWGGVSAADVLLFKKHIASISQLSGIFLASGDVNGTGTLTAADVLVIKKRIIHVINSFESGDWLFDNQAINVNGSNLVVNFNGLCYGDANGSYTPSVKSQDPGAGESEYSGILSILQPVLQPDNSILVPIGATGINDLGAFQFTLRYNPDELAFSGIRTWHQGIEDVTWGEPSPGTLTFIWAADMPMVSLLSESLLTELVFAIKKPSTAALTWSEQPTTCEFTHWSGHIFVPKLENLKSNNGSSSGAMLDGLSVYPNPGNGVFMLECNNPGLETLTIKVISTLGMTVYEGTEKVTGEQYRKILDLSLQPSGIYFIQVRAGDKIAVKSLVIR